MEAPKLLTRALQVECWGPSLIRVGLSENRGDVERTNTAQTKGLAGGQRVSWGPSLGQHLSPNSQVGWPVLSKEAVSLTEKSPYLRLSWGRCLVWVPLLTST